MATPKDRLVTAKYLSDWTLVRLPNGQVGVFTRHGGSYRVTFATQGGVVVPPDTELEIIKHPAELAMEALRTYGREPNSLTPP